MLGARTRWRVRGCRLGSASHSKRSRKALRAGAVWAVSSVILAWRVWAASRARRARCSGVTWYLDLHRPDLGQHRLGPGAVAGVPAPATGRVIAQMLGHLGFQRGFQHLLGQPTKTGHPGPTRPTPCSRPAPATAPPVAADPPHPSKAQRLGHDRSFPPSPARRVDQDQIHRCSDSPAVVSRGSVAQTV